jgi:hypothetical protein
MYEQCLTSTDPAEPHLPPLPFWQARSFWLALVAVAGGVAQARGIDLVAALGFTDPPELVDAIMELVPAVAALLAWRERMSPRRRLALSGAE